MYDQRDWKHPDARKIHSTGSFFAFDSGNSQVSGLRVGKFHELIRVSRVHSLRGGGERDYAEFVHDLNGLHNEVSARDIRAERNRDFQNNRSRLPDASDLYGHTKCELDRFLSGSDDIARQSESSKRPV